MGAKFKKALGPYRAKEKRILRKRQQNGLAYRTRSIFILEKLERTN